MAPSHDSAASSIAPADLERFRRRVLMAQLVPWSLVLDCIVLAVVLGPGGTAGILLWALAAGFAVIAFLLGTRLSCPLCDGALARERNPFLYDTCERCRATLFGHSAS